MCWCPIVTQPISRIPYLLIFLFSAYSHSYSLHLVSSSILHFIFFSSCYLLFFPFLISFLFVSLSLSLAFCLHVYFNLFGFTLPTKIPETTLRAGRSGLRIPVAETDPPPQKVPTGSAAQPLFYFMSTGFFP